MGYMGCALRALGWTVLMVHTMTAQVLPRTTVDIQLDSSGINSRSYSGVRIQQFHPGGYC